MNDIIIGLGLVSAGLLIYLATRPSGAGGADISPLRDEFSAFRKESADSARENREEISKSMASANETLSTSLKGVAELQKNQLTGITKQMTDLTAANQAALDRMTGVLNEKMTVLQESNEKKLEEMRVTVDEKLHTTLEKRLGESFKLVSDQLNAVSKGLGEMQTLASDVGNLQRALTNVKQRGVMGEVQLGALLEQVLAPSQYQKNVKMKEDSGEMVEFAIKLPGSKDDPGSCVWLPIDAKFPQEDYLRIVQAAEENDAAALATATKQLTNAIKKSAQDIHDKYLNPPATTDFAILFLATEGLYAEALRQPSLVEDLQRQYQVTLAGPTTLLALISSLRMGFQTLAIEQQTFKVRQILGAVKTEFGKFGDVLAKVKKQLGSASNTIGATETRTRAMLRELKTIEALPDGEAGEVLGIDASVDDELFELESKDEG